MEIILFGNVLPGYNKFVETKKQKNSMLGKKGKDDKGGDDDYHIGDTIELNF